jgi:hypothetical protein
MRFIKESQRPIRHGLLLFGAIRANLFARLDEVERGLHFDNYLSDLRIRLHVLVRFNHLAEWERL